MVGYFYMRKRRKQSFYLLQAKGLAHSSPGRSLAEPWVIRPIVLLQANGLLHILITS